MSALKELLASFGVEVDASSFQRATHAVDGLQNKFGTAVKAFAGLGVAHILKSWVEETLEFGDKLDKTSQQIGVSADQLQEWNFIAGRSGLSLEEFAGSMRMFSRQAAGDGAKGASFAASLKKIGVSAKDSKGEFGDVLELLPGIAQGFSKMPDGVEKTALAMEIFGKSGATMLPLLNEGEEGIAALRDKWQKLGGSISGFDKSAAQAKDALEDIDTATKNLKNRLVITMAPAIEKVATVVSEFVGSITKSPAAMRALQWAMYGLIGVLGLLAAAWIAEGVAMIGANLPIVLITAAIVGLAAAVYDLTKLVKGEHSVIGEFFDDLLGKGASDKMASGLLSAWKSWKVEVYEALTTMIALFYVLGDVAAKIWDGAKTAFGAFVKVVTDEINNIMKFPALRLLTGKELDTTGGRDFSVRRGLKSSEEQFVGPPPQETPKPDAGGGPSILGGFLKAIAPAPVKAFVEGWSNPQPANVRLQQLNAQPDFGYHDRPPAGDKVQQTNNVTVNVYGDKNAQEIAKTTSDAVNRTALNAVKKP